MSRSSRRRRRGTGDPVYRSSGPRPLPRAHEGVRRFLDAVPQALSVPAASSYVRQLRRTVMSAPKGQYWSGGMLHYKRGFHPVLLAKQREALLSSGRYSWLKTLSMLRPRKVLFCVRRKIRREVLHAFGIAGSRGLGGGRFGYRRTQDSQYSC